jgi:hypothetical protein
MYASELRTCGLGAVVAVLLGGSVGFGWHVFADGGRAVAAAITPLAQRAASNPPLACPPPPREGPVRDVPVAPVLARPNNAKSGVTFAHSSRAGRARQVTRSDGADGG